MRRKYNALFHILATLKYETYVVFVKVKVNVTFYLILYKNFFTNDGDTVMQNIAKANRFADLS